MKPTNAAAAVCSIGGPAKVLFIGAGPVPPKTSPTA